MKNRNITMTLPIGQVTDIIEMLATLTDGFDFDGEPGSEEAANYACAAVLHSQLVAAMVDHFGPVLEGDAPFTTHNQGHVDIAGTHLIGYLEASGDDITRVFGPSMEPNSLDAKTDWEWQVRFDDGTVATIYNYKNGPNYGHTDVKQSDVWRWHVGGRDEQAHSRVVEAVNNGRS